MPTPILITVTLWSWFALSLIAHGFLSYFAFQFLKDGDRDWEAAAAIVAFESASIGLSVCPLLLLGHPVIALSLWRILSGYIIVVGCVLCWRSVLTSTYGDFAKKLALLAATAATAFFFVISLLLHTLPAVTGIALTRYAVLPATSLHDLDFWHVALLVLLCIIVFACAMLFLVSIQREGPISFERNWGGLGGSSGGWQISSSLTYLAGTLFFGALLLTLIFHEDNRYQPTPSAADTTHASDSHPPTK